MITNFINIFIGLLFIVIGSLAKEIITWICDTIAKLNLPEKVNLIITVLTILFVISTYLALALEFVKYLDGG